MSKFDGAKLEDVPGAATGDASNASSNPLHFMKDIMKNMPGIDEAMNFNELLK